MDFFGNYIISFFGHRYIEDMHLVEYFLKKIIIEILCENDYINFLVGNKGDFDKIVSSTIHNIKRKEIKDNFSHILVLPYSMATLKKDESKLLQYYDDVEVCNESSREHFKRAYRIKNEKMIERSDVVVVYVCENNGGAFEAMKYAQCKGKKIINIADLIKKSEG